MESEYEPIRSPAGETARYIAAESAWLFVPRTIRDRVLAYVGFEIWLPVSPKCHLGNSKQALCMGFSRYFFNRRVAPFRKGLFETKSWRSVTKILASPFKLFSILWIARHADSLGWVSYGCCHDYRVRRGIELHRHQQKSTNGRHCHNPIDIADMPFMFDKICNFPSNVRENLKIGDTVVLKGRGTKFGLFPHQIEYH